MWGVVGGCGGNGGLVLFDWGGKKIDCYVVIWLIVVV